MKPMRKERREDIEYREYKAAAHVTASNAGTSNQTNKYRKSPK